MNLSRVTVLAMVIAIPASLTQPVLQQARQLERAGDARRARQMLQRAVEAAPADPSVLAAYAEFLDRYRDPASREAYERLLEVLPATERSRRAEIARRLLTLDLLAGDRDAARRRWNVWQQAEGRPAGEPPFERAPVAAVEIGWTEIPGPLPSFLRMAAVSQDVTPEDLLPALARNVVTNGYRASASGEALEPTEYMKLLQRYLSQAHELEKLAGNEKVIRIEACESPRTGELLRVLGYRIRGACGGELALETVNATRAFLTIDSGFPLAELEQALRTNQPFVYPYQATRVPVLFGPEAWLTGRERQGATFIDVFLGDPALCRLYLGFSKLDRETAEALRRVAPLERLRAFGHVLDFFGAMFAVRNGRAIVPGGARAEKAWAELVGVSPEQGAAFFERLLTRDDGWLASYFDA
ncbi:MAG: tetratricopeptide repeat protein, partial [Bryobacteraceae bacterium]